MFDDEPYFDPNSDRYLVKVSVNGHFIKIPIRFADEPTDSSTDGDIMDRLENL